MPFALLLIGLLLVSAGARNRGGDLGALLTADFTGPNNFFYWIGGIGAVGAIGYFPPLRNVSRLFLFLIILSMLIADQGFLAQLQTALSTLSAPPKPTEADVGTATADPGAAATGPSSPSTTPSPPSTNDLQTQFPDGNIPDDTPIPSDFQLPIGAQGITTIGALRAWFNSLPATSQTGPSQQYPYVASGQISNSFSNLMNKNVGVPPTITGNYLGFFGQMLSGTGDALSNLIFGGNGK